jgi:hypothetical protein
LVVIHQQADVMQLDLVPHFHGLLTGLEFLLQPHRAFLDAQVVKLDAFALGALLTMPVCRFKTMLGAGRFSAEQAVVAVEAIHHRLGDVVGLGRIKALGEHGE